MEYLCDKTRDCADNSDESPEQCAKTDHTTPGPHAGCDGNEFRWGERLTFYFYSH